MKIDAIKSHVRFLNSNLNIKFNLNSMTLDSGTVTFRNKRIEKDGYFTSKDFDEKYKLYFQVLLPNVILFYICDDDKVLRKMLIDTKVKYNFFFLSSTLSPIELIISS